MSVGIFTENLDINNAEIIILTINKNICNNRIRRGIIYCAFYAFSAATTSSCFTDEGSGCTTFEALIGVVSTDII
jgi:hypothetical protein